MERGKKYVFLNSKGKYMVGRFFGENKEGTLAFVVENSERPVWFSKEVHDKLNTENITNNFIEYIAKKFQNKFNRNVSVWQENYEFKISIPKYYMVTDTISLDTIEYVLDNILEDWWSIQWSELEYNSIQVKRDEIAISFRVHDVHEVQFRYNDKEL